LWDIHQPVRALAEDIIKIHYRETTSEDIEDLMCAAVIVIYRVRKPVRLLQLLAVTCCVLKCPLNPITNPKSKYSHSYM
jgi:hypothetical protein